MKFSATVISMTATAADRNRNRLMDEALML
jgi:hypothetical protein